MSFPSAHNIGAYIKSICAAAVTALTAAGTGDNTAVTGDIIDRAAYSNPLSMSLVLAFTAVLAATKTLTFKTVKIQSGAASDGSDMADFAVLETTGTVFATGAGTIDGQAEYDVDLAGAGRYIRVLFTPDLSNTATDTATVAAVVVLGGADTLPI
jgi:hypothetical protein